MHEKQIQWKMLTQKEKERIRGKVWIMEKTFASLHTCLSSTFVRSRFRICITNILQKPEGFIFPAELSEHSALLVIFHNNLLRELEVLQSVKRLSTVRCTERIR